MEEFAVELTLSGVHCWPAPCAHGVTYFLVSARLGPVHVLDSWGAGSTSWVAQVFDFGKVQLLLWRLSSC